MKCIFIAMFGITPLLARPEVPAPATYPRPPYDSKKLTAPPAPSPPVKIDDERTGWYVGLGLGGGSGTYTENGTSGRVRGWDSTSRGDFPVRYLNFAFGKAVNARLLVGGDLTLFRSYSDTECSATRLTIANYDIVVTLFPWKRGFFMRNGLGISAIGYKDPVRSRAMQYGAGGNLLTGVGYAIPLGRSLHLTVSVDYSRQRYLGARATANASQIVAGWVGFNWY